MAKEAFLQLDFDRLFSLFPAGLVFDQVGQVQRTGPSLAAHLPGLAAGALVHEHFRFCVAGEDLPFELAAGSLDPVDLISLDGAVRLSGMIIVMPDGWFAAVRHMPWQFTLAHNTLQMSDFGPDDPAVAGMMLVGLQKAMLEEAQEAALELTRERQRSEVLLERISRVAGFMAHDFNNFLSIIRLNTQRILDDEHCVPRIARLVGIINETAARGSEISRSLMTLSRQRYDSGVPLDIDRLLQDHLGFMRTVVGRSIEVELQLGGQGRQVVASRVAMLNCIINSLINARDAMPQGGQVMIATDVRSAALGDAEKRDYVAIKISDSGHGMAAEVLSQAFEPMFSTKPHGNGFGLASILDFAQEMGGDACIESEPGAGTSLHMYLPALADSGALQSPSQLPRSGAVLGGDTRTRVLLVEDEPYALEALSEMLEEWGLNVTACISADAAYRALDAADSDQYQILLCDVLLGNDNGVDLARRACYIIPHIRIVLMSGYVPDNKEIEKNWNFIRKPLDIPELKILLMNLNNN